MTQELVTKSGTIQAARMKLSDVRESPWNVNVMDPATFDRLVQDMKAAGPEGTDPIDVATLRREWGFPVKHEEITITIDGAHRLRAALQLGWEYLYAIKHPDIKTEEEAQLFNYKRDADRGQIDPFKLAGSFKWFEDVQKLSQEQIAKKFGVDRSTISHRLSLLKVDEQVKEYALKSGTLSTSHLEVVAGLEPDLQREVVKDLQKDWRVRESGGVLSVKVMQQVTQEVKREAQDVKRFRDAVSAAKFPTCPKCGKQPIRSHLVPPIVECETRDYDHQWNLNTGKPRNRYEATTPTRSTKPSLPQHVKSDRLVEEYNAAGNAFLMKLYPELTEISHVHLTGKKGKKLVDLDWINNEPGNEDYEVGGFSLQYSVYKDEDGGKPEEKLELNIDGNGTANKEFKTYIKLPSGSYGTIETKKDLQELEETAEKFLKDWLPRGFKQPKPKEKRK